MKSTASFVLLFITVVVFSKAQTQGAWSIPKHEIVFKDEKGEVAKMWMDPGLRYADISYEGRSYRVFYHHNNSKFKRARFVDNESKMEIGRAKGNLGGAGRFIFINGEEINVKRKRYPNGYEIIGPYGPLFKVENHGVSPVKTFQETDFLVQAFFLFDRIKITQTPPAEVIMLMTSN
ncbi:hypothetical protein EF405_06075 [Cyclobacteriaceae bacterium YHN15]|nr:hypothetical protein EF405_06075 [Cyclobacteriaceae bacterium YHN15]